MTFDAVSTINGPIRKVSISIGEVPLDAFKITQQELICAHGVAVLVVDPTEEHRRSALQESEYNSRDADGRITTTIHMADDLATFANQLQDWVRDMPGTTHSGVFEASPSL